MSLVSRSVQAVPPGGAVEALPSQEKVLILEPLAASVTPAVIRRERTAHHVSPECVERNSRKWAEPLISNPPPCMAAG